MLVAQLCLTLCDPIHYSVHGTLQARILACIAIPFSGRSSWPRDRTWVCCIAGRFFTVCATREAYSHAFVVVVVQSLSCVWLFTIPWTAACQASLSFTISQSLLKLMSIESVMPSNHPILCRLLLLLPSIFFSIRVFSNESALCIRWPKFWSFSFSISSFGEFSRLISIKIDWFDLPAVQGTLL